MRLEWLIEGACFVSLVSGIIIEVVYGHVVTSTDDVHMKLVEDSVRLVSGVGSVGATIIDLLPFRA